MESILSRFFHNFYIVLANFKHIPQTMKYWLSHLPLEVWVDVFRYPWIKRQEMGQIVDRIGNYQFAEYLQFYLHDWGKQKLHQFRFTEEGMYKCSNGWKTYQLDFPQTPMPSNIKSIDYISIFHFDAQTLNFLRRIQPILTNVNLYLWNIHHERESAHTVLAHLLPLLNGIHSLTFFVLALPTIEQCFAGDQLANIKVLEIYREPGVILKFMQQIPVNFILNWLTSPQQHNNGPKLCELRYYSRGIGLIAAIRQQFLAATTPSTFAVINHHEKEEFDEFHLENNLREELHGQVVAGTFQITRHKTSRGTELAEWVKENKSEEWDKENKSICRPRIEITRPTIGLIDAIDAPESAEDEQQKPSTSKDA